MEIHLGERGRRWHIDIRVSISIKIAVYLSTSSCLDEGCHYCGSPLFAPSESKIEDLKTCYNHSACYVAFFPLLLPQEAF